MSLSSHSLLWSLAVAAGPSLIAAQAPVLTLQEAITVADSTAFPNRIARAGTKAASARARGADQAFLPTLRLEAGVVRTTDPLGAFGSLLRQRTVTAAAFDPNELNSPPARTDLGVATVAEVPILNLDAWAGRRAASHAATALAHQAEWTADGVRLDVLSAYYGVVLAQEKVGVLRLAVDAATSHVKAAELALRNGVVTRSDLLLAQVRLGEVEIQQLAAASANELAWSRLAVALGVPHNTTRTLPTTIPSMVESGDVHSEYEQRIREDVEAAASDARAATAELLRRSYALLPRFNGFARYEWHDKRTLFAGQPMWTIGVMASWTPFSGGSELATRIVAAADAEAAVASLEAVKAKAQLDAAAAERSLTVAKASLLIATRGVTQATEAHRIVERKYEGGLATVAELLDAEATELSLRLKEAEARYELILALGRVTRARGASLTPLVTALDAASQKME